MKKGCSPHPETPTGKGVWPRGRGEVPSAWPGFSRGSCLGPGLLRPAPHLCTHARLRSDGEDPGPVENSDQASKNRAN